MGQSASRPDLERYDRPVPPASANSTDAEDEPPARENAVVPTVLQWAQGGASVYVTGSFNAWGERILMRRSGNECVVCLNLVPGTYQYKFIVDNEWRFAADQPTVRDEMGNINNCITVEDQSLYMREENKSGFLSEEGGANHYTQALPDAITLAKEPPQAPVHLWCLSLNVPLITEPCVAGWTLPPPLHVTLNHLNIIRTAPTCTLAATTRVRHKHVTIVLVKPRAAPLSWGPAMLTGGGGAGEAERDAAAHSLGFGVGAGGGSAAIQMSGVVSLNDHRGGGVQMAAGRPPAVYTAGHRPLGTTPSLSPGGSLYMSRPSREGGVGGGPSAMETSRGPSRTPSQGGGLMDVG